MTFYVHNEQSHFEQDLKSKNQPLHQKYMPIRHAFQQNKNKALYVLLVLLVKMIHIVELLFLMRLVLGNILAMICPLNLHNLHGQNCLLYQNDSLKYLV